MTASETSDARPAGKVLETERLALRLVTPEDDGFVLELLNEESFLRFIGDRGVRTLDDARRYIADRIIASYEKFGYGMYAVALKDTGEVMGLCGMVRRDTLPDADIGFAFLPRFWSRGYAIESAAAVLAHARESLGLARVLAITDPANESSIRLLEKIGLRFQRTVRLTPDDIDLNLYEIAW